MARPFMENRHGLLVNFQVTEANGTAERNMARQLLQDAMGRGFHPATMGADKELRHAAVCGRARDSWASSRTWRSTQAGGRSAIDGRTTRYPGCAVSQRLRKRRRRSSAG